MQQNARAFKQAMSKPEFASMAIGYGWHGNLPKTQSSKLLVSEMSQSVYYE